MKYADALNNTISELKNRNKKLLKAYLATLENHSNNMGYRCVRITWMDETISGVKSERY